LLFILLLPTHFAIQLQLLGGVLILQTLPAIVSGIYTRWFDPRALLFAWALALAWAIWAASLSSFQKSSYALHLAGWTIPGYIGLYALFLNVLLALAGTLVLRSLGRHSTVDHTDAAGYAELRQDA
jgi:SSS family solute:Na+ symporter